MLWLEKVYLRFWRACRLWEVIEHVSLTVFQLHARFAVNNKCVPLLIKSPMSDLASRGQPDVNDNSPRILQPKCVPLVFLGSLLGTRRSAIGQFFPLFLVTFPEVFAKGNSTRFLYHFWRGILLARQVLFPHFDALWHAHCRHPCILFFSDTFVRVLYYVQRKVVERKKTKVVKKSTSPVFNEAFVFDMKDEEPKHSSIMCEVYRGDTVKKTNRIGYITLGLESFGSELRHWNDMIMTPLKRATETHLLHA